MKNYLLIGILFGMILLSGCAQTQTQTQEQGQQGQIVGNDKDAHGCIPSAGYSWCEALQQCIRPWETNCTAPAEETPASGVECTTVADCGLGAASCVNGKCSQYDANGCVPDGGYSWCEAKQKCIRAWEENCTEQMVGNDADEHGCIGSAGYSWCEAMQQCIRPWENDCPGGQMVGNDSDEHGCKASAGYSWCAAKQKCIRSWEENCTSTEDPLEVKAKTYCNGQNVAKVYTCGQYIRTVSDLMGGGSTFYDVNGAEITSCPVVAPDYMSTQCQQLLLGNNCVEKEIC